MWSASIPGGSDCAARAICRAGFGRGSLRAPRVCAETAGSDSAAGGRVVGVASTTRLSRRPDP
eukprot:10308199-Lingulodinium_polyedra.AAC.1